MDPCCYNNTIVIYCLALGGGLIPRWLAYEPWPQSRIDDWALTLVLRSASGRLTDMFNVDMDVHK